MRTKILGAGIGFLLTGCMTIPPLEQDGVAISEIVQRIKCELASAVPKPTGVFPTGDFQWIKYWTAKVDLDLQTTDQSVLTANTNFIDPMKQAILPGIGTFAQNFTLSAGASIDGTAQRTDKISFTLSISELQTAMSNGECDLPQRLGLLGKLGLEEWVSSALAPVANKQLTIGYHDTPTGKNVKVPGVLVTFAADPTPEYLQGAVGELRRGEKLIEEARKWACKARESALKYGKPEQEDRARRLRQDPKEDCPPPTEIGECVPADTRVRRNAPQQSRWEKQQRKAIQDTYCFIEQAFARLGRAKEYVDEANGLAWKARRNLLDKMTYEELEKQKIEKEFKAMFTDRAKDASDQVKATKEDATASWNFLPRDPPLDSITHSAKFTVVANANVMPTWTLVRFKGPGLNVPFAKAERKRVHNVDVVLGAPAEPGGKALSDEQRRQLLNLRLDALRLLVVPSQ